MMWRQIVEAGKERRSAFDIIKGDLLSQKTFSCNLRGESRCVRLSVASLPSAMKKTQPSQTTSLLFEFFGGPYHAAEASPEEHSALGHPHVTALTHKKKNKTQMTYYCR